MKLSYAYFVYGNHGQSPPQLDDYFSYLKEAFDSQGYLLRMSELPVAGELNLLIECFDAQFTERVIEVSRAKNTRFILLATEFITGRTFNQFPHQADAGVLLDSVPRAPSWARRVVSRAAPLIFPNIWRDQLFKTFPKTYKVAREMYFQIFGYSVGSWHHQEALFADRFSNFEKVAEVCEIIWCVSPHQLPEYISKFGAHRVRVMPMVSWTAKIRNVDQGRIAKDIDFLFTGSLTAYRRAVLQKLTDAGFNVMIGPATWPMYIRDHFIARSKVSLQIRQDPQWRYPSVMRYHYLLASGAVIVAEEASERCFQEQFLVLAPPDQFIAACKKAISDGQFAEAGKKACEQYFLESEKGRKDFAALFSILPSETLSLDVMPQA